MDLYSSIPFKSLRAGFVQAYDKNPKMVVYFTETRFTSMFGASRITKFLLQFLLVPSILFLILYAMMEPIAWGAVTFAALCLFSMTVYFIIRRMFRKKQQKETNQ